MQVVDDRTDYSFSIFPWVQKNLDLPQGELIELTHLSKRTLDRRKQKGEFDPSEWERVNRFREILENAVRVIGDEENARQWLKTPKQALNGKTPLEAAKTESGAREVFRVLGRIEHGVFG